MVHRVSPSYSLRAGKELGPAHVLDAVRLLTSWLWDDAGDWGSLTVQSIKQALSSARERDDQQVDTEDSAVAAVQESKRQKR